MKTYVLKQATNHIEYLLIEERNSFGDQILKIRHENLEGFQKYVWTERNPEGSHRNISPEFLEYLTSFMKGLGTV